MFPESKSREALPVGTLEDALSIQKDIVSSPFLCKVTLFVWTNFSIFFGGDKQQPEIGLRSQARQTWVHTCSLSGYVSLKYANNTLYL